MAKRSVRKRRRPDVGGPEPTETPDASAPPPPPIVVVPWEWNPARRAHALQGQVRVAEVMLIECPSFYAFPDFEKIDVMVSAVPRCPILCRACGRTIPVAEQTGCPRLLSSGQAMRLLLPPEILHADA